MTFCLSSLDFKVLKVFIRIWFNDVHSVHCDGPWLQGFDDLVDHSRIKLHQAWESKGFRNHELQSIECHCALKGYTL
jgi:hypothetical protein